MSEGERSEATAKGRAAATTALDKRLTEQYELDPEAPDYGQRLAYARKAHFAQLALKSARSRTKKRRPSAPAARYAPGVLRSWGWPETENVGEFKVMQALRDAGVEPREVEFQFNVGRLRLDFAFVEQRIAVEADGWVHLNKQVEASDQERDAQLTAWGWRVYRIDVDGDVPKQLAPVIKRVRRSKPVEDR